MKKRNSKQDTINAMNEKPEDFISLKVDYAFSVVMKNPQVLRGFISAVLGIEPKSIQEITILDRHLNRRFAEDKLGILDVRAKIENIGDIDIEVQVRPFSAWGERSVYYSDKMYIENMEKGNKYNKNIRVISISVLNFNYLEDEDYFYSPFHIWHDWKRIMLTNAKEFHIIELKKLDRLPPRDEHKNLMKWCRLINAESEEERMTIEQDEYIKEALKELEKLSNDPQKRAEYDARDKAIKDYVTELMEAEERGIAQGKAQGEERIIRLNFILQQEDRMDDLIRCIKDEEYRRQLLEEYDLL